jgi:hypothetical protein
MLILFLIRDLHLLYSLRVLLNLGGLRRIAFVWTVLGASAGVGVRGISVRAFAEVG